MKAATPAYPMSTLTLSRLMADTYELPLTLAHQRVAAHRRILAPELTTGSRSMDRPTVSIIMDGFLATEVDPDRYPMPRRTYCHHTEWNEATDSVTAPCGLAATCALVFPGEWDYASWNRGTVFPLCGFHGNPAADRDDYGLENWIYISGDLGRVHAGLLDDEPPF